MYSYYCCKFVAMVDDGPPWLIRRCPRCRGVGFSILLTNSIHLVFQPDDHRMNPSGMPACRFLQSVESSSSTETTAHVYSISRIPSQLLYIFAASNYFDALAACSKNRNMLLMIPSVNRSIGALCFKLCADQTGKEGGLSFFLIQPDLVELPRTRPHTP